MSSYLKRLFITLFAALGMALGGIAMAYDGGDHERPDDTGPVMEQPADHVGFGEDERDDDRTGDEGW